MQCEKCNCQIRAGFALPELFFKPASPPALICAECTKQFKVISGLVCRGCGKPRIDFCADCQLWAEQGYPLLNNQALYAYDASMKWFFEVYKFMGGYHLRNLFVAEIQAWIHAPILVPIPVTDTTMQTRGFNQTLGLLGELPYHEYLRCKVDDKPMQSKKTREARLQSPQPFELAVDQALIEQQDIVLFDDVYTTGRTLYHAAECLYAAGANKVSSMTLSR